MDGIENAKKKLVLQHFHIPSQSKMSQSKNWCFTLNNPEVQLEWADNVKYAVWQLEQGESGTPHYQGYVEFKTNQRFNALKLLQPRAHWEPRRKTRVAAIKYCTKDDSRIDGPWFYPEEGVAEVERVRRPTSAELALLDAKKDIETTTMTLEELIEKHFYAFARNQKFLTDYYNKQVRNQRAAIPDVILLIGEKGTGKSKWAWFNYPDLYPKNSTKWWDGYDSNKTVLFDDYNGKWFMFTDLLKITDRYPYIIEVKGGSQRLNVTTMIFTSNKTPRDWYRKVDDISPFYRRVSKVIWAKSEDEHIEYTGSTAVEDFYLDYDRANLEPTVQTIRPPNDYDSY